jgi:hypothetical protein
MIKVCGEKMTSASSLKSEREAESASILTLPWKYASTS